MELATLVGISISEFWEITPFELNIAAKSYEQKRKSESQDLILQAYLISRWVWARKKINIEKILNADKKKKVMTDEQMLEQVKVLNMLFGGEVKTVGKE